MSMALKRAGLSAGDIDYVNAHGTSTPIGDELELRAVERLLGNSAAKTSMSSTKSSNRPSAWRRRRDRSHFFSAGDSRPDRPADAQSRPSVGRNGDRPRAASSPQAPDSRRVVQFLRVWGNQRVAGLPRARLAPRGVGGSAPRPAHIEFEPRLRTPCGPQAPHGVRGSTFSGSSDAGDRRAYEWTEQSERRRAASGKLVRPGAQGCARGATPRRRRRTRKNRAVRCSRCSAAC